MPGISSRFTINCGVQDDFLSLKNLYKTKCWLTWKGLNANLDQQVIDQWCSTPNHQYTPLTINPAATNISN